MIELIKSEVQSITYSNRDITRFDAEIDGCLNSCINYNRLTGEIAEKDVVLLNTTAGSLGLGSGGFHLVAANLSRDRFLNRGEGHIMKLRYTPIQMNVLAAEAQESPYHEIFKGNGNLGNMPVIVGTLHSMVAPAALALKHLAGMKTIAYIMTDGGALPLWLSDTARRLCGKGVIAGTITYGNAFGGDIECINIYTALIAAREIIKADAALVCMGPGIAGTDTVYGFSGIEQSLIVDAVNRLQGKAVAIPRISFSDERERHYGISHHSRTTLGKLCFTRASVALPKLAAQKMELLEAQLAESGILARHDVSFWDTGPIEKLFEGEQPGFEKMGKGYNEDREYFLTCGASAFPAFEACKNGRHGL